MCGSLQSSVDELLLRACYEEMRGGRVGLFLSRSSVFGRLNSIKNLAFSNFLF